MAVRSSRDRPTDPLTSGHDRRARPSPLPASRLAPPHRSPAPAISVHPASLADVDEVAAVLATVFHPPIGFQALVWPLLKASVRVDLRRRFQRAPAHYCCVGAWTDSGLVGLLEIGLRRTSSRERGLQRDPYVANLAVLPEWRRCGVASNLMDMAETVVRLWGCDRIFLHVMESNAAARQFYRHCGYQLHTAPSDALSWLGTSRQLLLCKSAIGPEAQG